VVLVWVLLLRVLLRVLLLRVSGVLLLRVRCAHKQIQPVYNAEPHPIIIRVELVHNALDHLSVRGAPHTPYQALGQRVQFLVAQEGEVFEFFGGVVGFGPLWAREGMVVRVEEGVEDEGGGEDWEGGYYELNPRQKAKTNNRGQRTTRDRDKGGTWRIRLSEPRRK